MILYRLRCAKAHEFESWFASAAGYDRQAKRGLVSCPKCGSTKIGKALMAPRIAKGGAKKKLAAGAAAKAPAATHAMAPDMPAEMRAVLEQVRKKVEENCDYVGDKFADEARKIHYGESKRRGIYGEASDAEAEELTEEGIDVSRIPWVPRAN